MKKLFVILCAALFGLSVQAQERGDFAAGLHTGFTTYKLHGLGSVSRFGIGAFGQYSLTNHWRLELEGIYHPMKDHSSDFTLGLNVHYLFNLTGNGALKLYPMAGYALAFGHTDTMTDGRGGTIEGDNTTDGGIQLGVGLQYNIGSNWFVSGEYRFQPGIFGDAHVGLVGVGYRF